MCSDGVLPQVLLRRWGVFWRPLEVRINKRAALTGCCMRLHNYCIDHRISEEDLHAMNGEEAIPVPGDNPNSDPPGSRSRWRRTPKFKDGRPVKFLRKVRRKKKKKKNSQNSSTATPSAPADEDEAGDDDSDSDIEEFDEPLPHPAPMARSVTRENLIEKVNKSGA